MKKIWGWLVAGLVLVGLGFGIDYALRYANIASAYVAKTMCSGVFVSGRSPQAVQPDLYAANIATANVDQTEQSVSASVYGLAPTKAVYRRGFGCTLLNQSSLAEVRALPALPALEYNNSDMAQKTTPSALQKAIEQSFVETDPEAPLNTRAVVVTQNGAVLAEKYAAGFSSSTPLLGWSMTKSVTNAMIGILVKDGKLDVTKPAPISEWQNDSRREITLDSLLRMSSGLAFVEDYGSPSDATNMLFRAKSIASVALASAASSKPNTVWSYSSGTTNILQEIIRRQFANHADYLAFPYQRLFAPLGMKSAILETDASGTFIGSSFMYATARDWAKFGQLYLQDGIWNGKRLLPEGWVKYSSAVTPNSDGIYAAQFWLAQNDPQMPKDAFMAEGFEGQTVAIIPSQKLVIVRLGLARNGSYNDVEFVKKILAALAKR